MSSLGSALVVAIVITLAGLDSASAQAPPTEEPNPNSRPAGAWASTLYGPNSSGAGVAIRYRVVGAGLNTFWFVGDTARGLPARPGGAFMTFDFYLLWDMTSWACIYGSAGIGGRISTYGGSVPLSKLESELEAVGVGGGLQISLLSRFTMGAGYNAVFMPIEGEGAEYDAIDQIALQLGYRF